MTTTCCLKNKEASLTTTKIVLIIEYDGTRYYGFQLQPTLPTIQGEIEKALWKLTKENSRVIAASRTDTGVHAKGQTISFRKASSSIGGSPGRLRLALRKFHANPDYSRTRRQNGWTSRSRVTWIILEGSC